MKMDNVFARIGALLCFGAASGAFAAPTCPSLEGASLESRLEYLRGPRAKLSQDCVFYAMERLGYGGYAPAVKVLITYLDYRAPEKPGFLKYAHLEWTGSVYPAGEALFLIGKPAVPGLIEAIADAATPDLVRSNAADVVSAVYRESLVEGIAVLVRAAHAQADPTSSVRLMDQARRRARECGSGSIIDCQDVLIR